MGLKSEAEYFAGVKPCTMCFDMVHGLVVNDGSSAVLQCKFTLVHLPPCTIAPIVLPSYLHAHTNTHTHTRTRTHPPSLPLVSCVDLETDVSHVSFLCYVSNKSIRVFKACAIVIRDYIKATFGRDVNVESFVHDMVKAEGKAFCEAFGLHKDKERQCEFHLDGALGKQFMAAMLRDGWSKAEGVKAWSHFFLIIEVLDEEVRTPPFLCPPSSPPLSTHTPLYSSPLPLTYSTHFKHLPSLHFSHPIRATLAWWLHL